MQERSEGFLNYFLITVLVLFSMDFSCLYIIFIVAKSIFSLICTDDGSLLVLEEG